MKKPEELKQIKTNEYSIENQLIKNVSKNGIRNTALIEYMNDSSIFGR